MSESRSTVTATLVRKRDGQYEPFMPRKVTTCVRQLLHATREGEPAEADELAAAICQVVRTMRPTGHVRSHELAALVPKVLTQTGHLMSAQAMRDHSKQRERRRRRLRVMLDSPCPATGQAWRRWDKGELVAWLQKRKLLEVSMARFMASRVEAILLALNLETITCGLVRELSQSKLLAWGLCDEAYRVERRH